MATRVDAVRHTDDHARTAGDRDLPGRRRSLVGLRLGLCGLLFLAGLYALADEDAHHLGFREGLDAAAGVEHDDAIAGADEVALQQGAIRQFNRIGEAERAAECTEEAQG